MVAAARFRFSMVAHHWYPARLLGLGIVLNVNEQADLPTALPGLFGGPGASGNAGDNGFFCVISAQWFELGKPSLIRRSGRGIFSAFDLVAFLLQPGK